MTAVSEVESWARICSRAEAGKASMMRSIVRVAPEVCSVPSIGSAAVMAALAAKHMDEPPAKRLERFAKLGTIDLRIDYLRPGIGEFFTIHAEALRVGSRVGTSRMEFRGPDGTLMSAGAAAYIVS